MFSQKRIRILNNLKHDFRAIKNSYREALRHYGFLNKKPGSIMNLNRWQIPALTHSKTLSKQTSLPKLPVPHLDASINRYLKAVRPLVNENEYEITRRIAADFVKKDGVGEQLQKLLIEKSKAEENWLSQWWLDKIYLEPRYNIVVNVNPGTLYPRAEYRTIKDQLKFATKYIMGFLDFKHYLETQSLPVEKMGESYLCMDQYYKLFGTCRIPNRQKDDVKVVQAHSFDLHKTNHITVLHKNRFFNLQVIDPETGINRSASDIYENLKKIVNHCSLEEDEELGLGILTAENRDIWSDCYNTLIKNEKNKRKLESIHNSLFVLCLDTEEKTKHKWSRDKSLSASYILHGKKMFTSNRWFDKTIQVIIGPKGVWGINFEHSIAEALPHSLKNDYIYNYITNREIEIKSKHEPRHLLKELKFGIPHEVKEQMKRSYDSVAALIDNLDLYILEFDHYGKNFPKSQKVSPDGYVQMAMQLAYYRTHIKPGNAYESGSLRNFHLGRTDIIRSCSTEAVEFVKGIQNPDLSVEEKARLLFRAISNHRLLTMDVINFESFDRHLLGLRLIAHENKIDVPQLYNDVAFRRAIHYNISSSQVSSKFDAVTFYGPAVDDGYGCCYNLTEKKILFGLTSWNSCTETSSKNFGMQLEHALLDCQDLLLKADLRSKL